MELTTTSGHGTSSALISLMPCRGARWPGFAAAPHAQGPKVSCSIVQKLLELVTAGPCASRLERLSLAETAAAVAVSEKQGFDNRVVRSQRLQRKGSVF